MNSGPFLTLLGMLGASALALAQSTGDAARGQRLFLQCQACHSLQAGNLSSIGPPLAAVVGRASASVPGYAYSSALSASKLVWNEDTLDKWLEQPNALVPGTKMIFIGLPNQADRADIISYLKKSSRTPAPQ